MSIDLLSKRQKEALEHINRYFSKNKYPPTLEELGKLMKIRSVSAVHKHVSALRAKGFLKNPIKSTRSISTFQNSEAYKEIPLLGTISAGAGIEPMENPEPINVASDLLCGSGSHYALKVSGDSMIEEGIFDGDTVIIRSQTIAQDGDTVVAIISTPEELATLKKIYYLGDKIELRAANPKLKDWPRQYNIGDIEIRGKFCGLTRKTDQ
jgi:repressor LexA